ncbi:hypothetical protein NB638_02615 [Oxalobacter formigenes]|nr:hypothetical protein NB638_02615 [Oxalobacter formigenes]
MQPEEKAERGSNFLDSRSGLNTGNVERQARPTHMARISEGQFSLDLVEKR